MASTSDSASVATPAWMTSAWLREPSSRAERLGSDDPLSGDEQAVTRGRTMGEQKRPRDTRDQKRSTLTTRAEISSEQSLTRDFDERVLTQTRVR